MTKRYAFMVGVLMLALAIFACAMPGGVVDQADVADAVEDVVAEVADQVEEEVAEVVTFLATKGSYINGTVLHVNGGMYGG